MRPHWLYSVLLAVILYSCSSESTASLDEDLKELPVLALLQKDTLVHQNYVADIQSVRNVEVRARTNGFLEKIFVEEGSFVQKGQLLFELSNQELSNTLNKARAALASAHAASRIAEVEVDRVKVLVDKEVIVRSELEMAEARLADAQAKVQEAQASIRDAEIRISYLKIRAPFTGLVDRFPIKPGSLITDGTLLTTLSDNEEVLAYFEVSENEYLQHFRDLRKRMNGDTRATLILSNGTVYPYSGVIDTKESEFSENTGTLAFRARFPNPDKLLKHGASGKVQLATHLHSKILIPQKSVLEIQDKSFVFLLDTANTIHLKSFVPTLKVADMVVAESGLKEGDVIVYEGIQNIRDGSRIIPQFPEKDETLISKSE